MTTKMLGLRTLRKTEWRFNSMSYVNNVSCDKCGKHVNERSMDMVKHKRGDIPFCLSCRDIDDDELDNLKREDLNEYKTVYTFRDIMNDGKQYHVYKHHDGYPQGAMQWIGNAIYLHGKLHDLNHDFACAFVCK